MASRSGARGVVAVACALLVLSCGGSGGSGGSEDAERDDSLVDHQLWRLVAAEDDVFGDRPAVVTCPFGWAPEPFGAGDSLGVDLALCDYLTVTQPSRLALAADEVVNVRVYHFPLESDDSDAKAHLAVALDGEVMWEHEIDIPSDVGLVDGSFSVPRAIESGVPVDFHVHNHGPNSYSLLWIERE